jgi:hypothetical protein
MKQTAKEIRAVIENAESAINNITDEEAGIKPSPEKWCKKEILGHLIDSAANNHQRFVRAVYKTADQFPTYNQNEWVRIQQYDKSSWTNLIVLWEAYNYHLCDLIERLPDDVKEAPINTGKDVPATLEFVVKDYLRHLKHHLEKIIE